MFNVQVAFFPPIINICKNPVLYFSLHLIALGCPAPWSIKLACDLLHSSAPHKRCLRFQKHIKINFSSFALNPWIWFVHTCVSIGPPLWLSWLRIHLQCGRPGFHPYVGKIPWRRKRLPTPVFWPGEFHTGTVFWLGTVQSMESQRVRHGWATFTSFGWGIVIKWENGKEKSHRGIQSLWCGKTQILVETSALGLVTKETHWGFESSALIGDGHETTVLLSGG